MTGEPEDISELVRPAPGSECVLDAGGGDAVVRVRLENRGEDARTVRVTPEVAHGDGETTGYPLQATEIDVPAGGTAAGEAVLEGLPDDVTGCAVRIDGDDPVALTLRRGPE